MLEIVFKTCLCAILIAFTLIIIVIFISALISVIQSIVDNFKNRKIKGETLKALQKDFDNMINELNKQEKQKCHEAIDKENN